MMNKSMVMNGVEMESVMNVKDGRNVVWFSKADLKGKVRILGHDFENIWKAFDYGMAGRKDDEKLALNWMLYILWQRAKSDVMFWSELGHLGDKRIIFSCGESEWGCQNKEMDAERKKVRKAIDEKYADKDNSFRNAKNAELAWELSNIACGTWTGKNKLGKLLRMCVTAIKAKAQPTIDYEYLDEVGIDWFGIRVSFTKKSAKIG